MSGFEKFWLLNFSKQVKYFKGMNNLFTPFKTKQPYVKQELLKIVNPYHLKNAMKFNPDSIGIHIRMGDFIFTDDEQSLRGGAWNYRLPIKWYQHIIAKINEKSNLPICIFSDANEEDLHEILKLKNCKIVHFGSAISDLIALSNSKVLVSSGSTFSMWASFLGQMPTIWFPGQMREDLINDRSLFEGEIDYNDDLPDSVIKMIQDG